MFEPKAFVLFQTRIAKAKNAVSASQILCDNELYRDSINSAYNAVLYALKALCTIESVDFRKDTGYLLFFYGFYISTGKIEMIYAAIAKEIFSIAQQNNKFDFYFASKTEAAKLQGNAFKFVKRIQEFVKEEY